MMNTKIPTMIMRDFIAKILNVVKIMKILIRMTIVLL